MRSPIAPFFVLMALIFFAGNALQAQCIDYKSQKTFALLKAEFEADLLKQYTFDKSSIGYGYQMYLKDIAERNMPLDMWRNPKSIKLAKAFSESDFFERQWIRSSELADLLAQDDDLIEIEPPVSYGSPAVEPKPKKDHLLFNSLGQYFDCVLTKESDPDYISIIGSLRQVPDLNPELVALTFATEVETLTESMKEYILLVFYVELLLRVHQVI